MEDIEGLQGMVEAVMPDVTGSKPHHLRASLERASCQSEVIRIISLSACFSAAWLLVDGNEYLIPTASSFPYDLQC